MAATIEEASWNTLSRSQYHLEQHRDKSCIYLVKTKTTLLLEGVDAELFRFFDQHHRGFYSDLVKRIPASPQINDHNLDSSLQKLVEFGLIQPAAS